MVLYCGVRYGNSHTADMRPLILVELSQRLIA
jgi:hypothetical protein